MEMEKHHHDQHCDDRVIKELHQFTIDEKPYFLPSGFYFVRDLKKVGHVPECHILSEIRGTDVDSLTDDTVTHIEGGEVFKSYPGKGQSS